MNSINWPASSVWVFIAQLGEHCSANAEATGSNPVEAPKIFFSGYFRNCLNCDSLGWSHTHFINIFNTNDVFLQAKFSTYILLCFKTDTDGNKWLCTEPEEFSGLSRNRGSWVTLLAEPFVSNERLCGNCVNFLLSMRKVSLWLTSTFSRRFSKQVLHARATRQLNHFLILPMKMLSCFKFQGNVSWDGYTLVNFLLTTVSPFCPIRGRGFVKMKQTLQMWRVQLKSHAYHQRAHFLTTAQSFFL